MIHHHDHALNLDIDLLLHLHLLTLPRDMTIESHTKKEEEIVARHLKEEESINPSLDQDLDQDTDRLHTIDKGVKEGIRDRQDPQGNICRGITRIHRLPSRPSHPYGRQPHSLIFMSTLYKASSRLPASS